MQVQSVWNSTNDRAQAEELGKPLGIRSPYHAAAIWANSRRNKEDDGWMILNAVSIGKDFAFVTFPGEMYDSVSVRMEENSPFNTTMMLGYCYHHLGYLPSRVAYKYTSYETDITRFVRGTDALVEQTYLQLLNGLKSAE